MGNPASVKEQVEGLVGSILRVFGTDTANNVAQGAAVWLRSVKESLKYLDPATNVFVEGGAAATAGVSLSNATTTTIIYGVIGRNNDNGIRYLRGKDTNQGETWALVENQFLSQPIVTRSAANSPAYTFVAYPGGLALNGSGRKISGLPNLNVTTTVTGTTADTDATLYVVYSD